MAEEEIQVLVEVAVLGPPNHFMVKMVAVVGL
jgi:hypothetical protein